MLLPYDWEVPEVFRQRLGEKAGKQRVMTADGHVLLVLHKVPAASENHREGVLFWRKPDGQWQSTGRGDGLYALRKHVEAFAEAVDLLDDRCEGAVCAADYFAVLSAVVPLHRTIGHTYQALQGAREAVSDDRELILLRDRAGEIERTADLLHHEATNGMNFRMAQRSEELTASSHDLARAGHRINLLAAIFLPLTAITSVFSMSLRSGLERFSPALFWIVLATSVGVGLWMGRKLERQ